MAFRKLEPLCDKIGAERIRAVIDDFYRRLSADPEIGHHFERIQDFPDHVKRIADFWYMNLGGRLEQPPTIDMVGKHAPLNLTEADLAVWMRHFKATTEDHLEPPLAAEWQQLADGIASRMREDIIRG
ncbi:group III truncated hemoglobin [Thioalkalivibrio sp. ALMg11]|uniref:group III truncated hemoglobin n=1 Tax=Thioalkalivibrio sp. ALMg11 TaxID=1158165 RepID=UPI00036D520B|nr:group III truncated hemoglobin [Thioalkalivibrio sp. ALMg11]